MKYRKKPVIVDVFCFDDDKKSFDSAKKFTKGNFHYDYQHNPHCYVETLEGAHYVTKGDFIIKGVAGEFYPCKPDIFKKTYEGVE